MDLPTMLGILLGLEAAMLWISDTRRERLWWALGLLVTLAVCGGYIWAYAHGLLVPEPQAGAGA